MSRPVPTLLVCPPKAHLKAGESGALYTLELTKNRKGCVIFCIRAKLYIYNTQANVEEGVLMKLTYLEERCLNTDASTYAYGMRGC